MVEEKEVRDGGEGDSTMEKDEEECEMKREKGKEGVKEKCRRKMTGAKRMEMKENCEEQEEGAEKTRRRRTKKRTKRSVTNENIKTKTSEQERTVRKIKRNEQRDQRKVKVDEECERNEQEEIRGDD